MTRVFPLSLALLVAGVGNAEAANLAVITSPPNALSLVVLLIAFAGLAVCYQVWTLVKGGLFSKIWIMFMIGFGLLALSRITVLLEKVEVFSMPEYVVPVLMVLMAGVFMYGLLQAKRILS